MARWQCNNCALVIDNGGFSGRIEDNIKEIDAKGAQPCPVCEQREGWKNLDYQSGLILPGGEAA